MSEPAHPPFPDTVSGSLAAHPNIQGLHRTMTRTPKTCTFCIVFLKASLYIHLLFGTLLIKCLELPKHIFYIFIKSTYTITLRVILICLKYFIKKPFQSWWVHPVVGWWCIGDKLGSSPSLGAKRVHMCTTCGPLRGETSAQVTMLHTPPLTHLLSKTNVHPHSPHFYPCILTGSQTTLVLQCKFVLQLQHTIWPIFAQDQFSWWAEGWSGTDFPR